MAADEGGRTTTAFQSITYATGAEPLRVQDVETHEVDGRRVMFS
jgi:CRISPR-associated protein Cas5h